MGDAAPTNPDDWLDQFRDANGELPAKAEPLKVTIAHLHPGDVSTSFARSLRDTIMVDLTGPRRLFNARGLNIIDTQQGAGRLERGRNQAVNAFLESDSDVLMFIDSDMGWDADAVERLVSTVEQTGHPIVGGLAIGAKPVGIFADQAMEQEWFPTVYRTNEVGGGFDTAFEYPSDVVEVGATGAAFVAITRQALEAIRDAEGDRWFDLVTDDAGTTFGEDMSFCIRAKRCGLPIHVDTRISTSHKKDIWLTESLYREMRRPASSAVTVVIPVKDQLELTRTLVGQLYAQGGYSDLLIFDNGSTDPDMVAWLEGQSVADVFDASAAAGIHEMWNAGIDEAVRRHHGLADVVLLNNDLHLGARFLQRLVGGMRDSTAQVVSGNYDRRRVNGVQQVHGICAGRYDGTGGLAGFAFAMRAEWVAGGYRFPEDDLAWYFGDNDLCLSVEQAGGWYGIVGDAHLVHVDGGGNTSGSLVGPTYQDDEAAFRRKWQPENGAD